jgi:1,4-dihydroxy-2-naphthoyl-CoA synthase
LTSSTPCVILNVSNEREENKMSKEEMINEVIKMKGLEDKMTIWFCEMCEKSSMNNRELCVAFRLVINYLTYEDEEDF